MKKVGLLALALYCGIIYTACGKEDTVYFEPDTQMESEEVTEAVLCPPASCYVYVCGELRQLFLTGKKMAHFRLLKI